jgi:glycosyltransferase involved in cell wall biosynthesis
VRVIFISHDASRTGAPILLLRLAKEVVKQKRCEIDFFLMGGGVLQPDFEKLADVTLLEFIPAGFFRRAVDKVLRVVGFKRFTAFGKFQKNIKEKIASADVIFANTVVSAQALMNLPLGGKKVITYIHELHVITRQFSDPAHMSFISHISTHVLVPSKYVKDFLVERYSFDPSKINFLNYIIPAEELVHDNPKSRYGNKFVVGTCGTLHWRKGYDLFTIIVRKLIKQHNETDIQFVWLGVHDDGLDYQIFVNDLEKAKIRDFVSIVPSSLNINGELAALDLFILTSREDAFPLVVLEAAGHSIPTISFNESGGISEFIHPGAGSLVDYLDVDAFCLAIIQVKKDRERLAQEGRTAKQRLIEYREKSVVDDFIAYCES